MAARSKPYEPNRPSVAELAAGALILPPGGELEVLLLHEKREDRWCFPKGHVEPGESMLAAARREVEEETGLRRAVRPVEVGSVHYRFYQPRKRRNVVKTVVYFVGRAKGRGVRLERGFDSYAWVPIRTARKQVAHPTDREILMRFQEEYGPGIAVSSQRRPPQRVTTRKRKGRG